MDNAIVNLPAHVSPEAMAQGTPTELKTGHVNHAATLFEVFGNEEAETTKVQTIQAQAIEYGLTTDEFQKACKKALEKASEMDTMFGFKAKDNAKGLEKYGPKRRTLNQRLSEAKQLFGVFKLNPDVLKERGYWSALSIAREYLREAGIKWDATKVLNSKQKSAKADAKLNIKALEEVMTLNPMQAGESIKTYQERMADLVDQTIEEKRNEAFTDAVNKVVKSLTEKHNTAFLMAVADKLWALGELETEQPEQGDEQPEENPEGNDEQQPE